MKSTIFQIKLVHTVIFWMLSLCVFHALWSGIADRITIWTGCAVALLLVESLVLWRFDWKCPLTILAERRGALRGSVADMFVPKWLADRTFPICGALFGVALILIAVRVFR